MACNIKQKQNYCHKNHFPTHTTQKVRTDTQQQALYTSLMAHKLHGDQKSNRQLR